MEGQGGNSTAMDHQSNENNQFTTEAFDRENEEWMEECHSILHSEEPINLTDLLAEGGGFTTHRDGNVDTEMPQMNSELTSTAISRNNDSGKNLIINLDDDSEDDDIDAMSQTYKRKLSDGSSRRMFVGETSRAFVRREVSQEDINMVKSQANFIDLEQQEVQVDAVQTDNGARNGTGVNVGTIRHVNPNPMGQGWAPQRNITSGTSGYSSVLPSSFSSKNQPTQPTQYNSTGHVPILPRMPVPPTVQPSGMAAPYRSGYYNTDGQPFYRQLIWSTNFDSVPPPGFQTGNIPNRPTNMNYQMLPGNVDSSSTNPTASPGYRPSNVQSNPLGSADQFARSQIPSQVANNQAEPWRPPQYGPFRIASISMPNEVGEWPELSMNSLREAGFPPDEALSIITAAERARLLNEIRNALRLLRGNSDLSQLEELQFFEQNIEEESSGLAEDVIEAHLRSRKYRAAAFGAPSENPPCCICLEEYVEGDDTAKSPCGHYFHLNCIKQWLLEKNSCPICKHTVVDV